ARATTRMPSTQTTTACRSKPSSPWSGACSRVPSARSTCPRKSSWAARNCRWPDAMGDNASQIAEWNGAVGQRWASLQPHLDQMVRPFGTAALEAAALRAGERVLDVGCGCGDTSFEIAQRVGASGSVLGVDISQPMLEVARRRAAEHGLSQV